MVGKTGLEPATPSSQNWCSSQLNYFPKCVVFYNTSDYHQPWELVSFTPTSDFHRRSPLVCTQPLWNSHCLLTCSLPSLSSIRFHIVLGILVPWTLTLWVYTWVLLCFTSLIEVEPVLITAISYTLLFYLVAGVGVEPNYLEVMNLKWFLNIHISGVPIRFTPPTNF